MPDDLARLPAGRKPTPAQPLMGLTILAVEDSRFASEALRLLAMRSGARFRRADCLASARRHLSVYRPTVLLVDLGLPDGSGEELITDLRDGDVTPPVILAISGEDGAGARAKAAGAHGFLPKPLESLGAFQAAILAHLPEELRPQGPRLAETDAIRPDRFALKDDLAHAAQVLDGGQAGHAAAPPDYAAQFVGSLARTAQDPGLAAAARALMLSGGACDAARQRLRQAVGERLSAARPI